MQNKQHGAPKQLTNKPKDFKKSFKSLFVEIKSIKWAVLIAILLAIISATINVYLPLKIKEILTLFGDFFIPNAMVNQIFDAILRLIILLATLYFGVFVIRVTSEILLTRACQKVSYKLREKMRKKLSNVKLKFYDNSSSGELISRVINDSDVISSNIEVILSQTIVSIFLIIAILGFMFSLSWQLSLLAIGILPISLGAGLVVMLLGQKHFKAQAKGVGKLASLCEENYSALRVLQAYGMQEEVIKTFKLNNNKLVNSTRKAVIFGGLIGPIINFINNFSYVLLATVGCILAINGVSGVTVASLLVFLQYSNIFNTQITQVTQISEQFQTMLASFERVSEILQTENDTENLDAKQNYNIVGKIEFKNVEFGYSENKILMKNVNFVVNPGEMVAVVGKTGAGKTTLVNLLMRFYDISSGEIKIDDININEFSKSFIRKNIGMVLQDVWLFNGTIAQNIAFGKPDATMEEIIEVCKYAECHHFISTLPDGYNTVIGEDGGNISVGQKQLLTIARALLTNPKILILDEATSSVDTKTESKIQSAMNKALKGRTSFVIAHRLSTIQSANKILVMENGDIIESGTHSELISKKGAYAKLYNSQN